MFLGWSPLYILNLFIIEVSGTQGEEDKRLQIAIENSMQTTSINGGQNEPLGILERQRKKGIPPGLVNFGNSCYFNSLVQALFNIPEFVKQVMSFNHEDELIKLNNKKEEDKKTPKKGEENKPDEYKYELLLKLKELFARMIKSEKAYQNAQEVHI